MPKHAKVVRTASGTETGLSIRTETDAPVFASKRGNSGRYDAVVEGLRGLGDGQWLVLGPFDTNLQALRVMPMRGYKRMRAYLTEAGSELEMHMHNVERGTEVWVRTVPAGTSESGPSGFVEGA
jgi:hypothetical protein